MFGSKKFKDVKTKKFENDKKRRQYFAIKNYYEHNNKMTQSRNHDAKRGKNK